MGLFTVVNLDQLDSRLILGPERYNPRRYAMQANLTISDIAEIVQDQFNPEKSDPEESFLVLDTGDASEGLILGNKAPVSSTEIGSTKKFIKQGDVIISRLRPYLKQVAYVDEKVIPANATVVCSTEFFVMRSRTNASIAFLVPYLLSRAIQEILCASQEGGHHPRFNRKALEAIPIPDWLIAERVEISATVVETINLIRIANTRIYKLVEKCDERVTRVINTSADA